MHARKYQPVFERFIASDISKYANNAGMSFVSFFFFFFVAKMAKRRKWVKFASFQKLTRDGLNLNCCGSLWRENYFGSITRIKSVLVLRINLHIIIINELVWADTASWRFLELTYIWMGLFAFHVINSELFWDYLRYA